MTGPTTVGSIDARLTLDTSEFDRNASEARREARELGAMSPEVRVDANVGPALARMAEVEAAEHRLDAANLTLATSERSLNTERATGASQSSLATALERARTAERERSTTVTDRNTEATARNTSATEALNTARALTPEARVDTNVGPALAGLEAVTRAEARLDSATRQAANAASTSYIANLRLEEVQGRRGVTELQLAAATEAAARADRNAAGAEERLIAATEALNTARATALAGSQENTSATDTDTQSTNQNVQANNQRISGIQVLIGLAPLLLAASAPIGSAAIGLGTAFGAMAVSGVAAIKGIKAEMDAGTVTGVEYTAGLKTMGGYLDVLGHTAAVSMLESFKDVTGTVGAYMPYMNGMVGTFAAQLGQIGNTALVGVLSGLKQMNPLLEAGGTELSKFVTWLFSFTNTNGFQQFIEYAITNLPPVMSFIEGVVTLAGNLLAAFAPLGPAVIGGLGMLVDLLNSFPLPVLAGIVTAGVLIGPAFKLSALAVATFGEAAAVAGGQVTFFGMAANLAVPVVGVLVAAIAGLGIMSATSAIGTNTATVAVQDYTEALRKDNEEIGTNVRAQAAKALSDSGAADAAQRHGIGLKDLLDASLQVPDAMNRVIAVNTALGNSTTQVAGHTTEAAKQNKADYDLIKNSVGSAGSEVQKTIEKQRQLADMLGTTGASAAAQDPVIRGLAGAYGVSADAYGAAAVAQAKTGEQLAATTLKMQLQNDAAGLLKGALDVLNGKAISAAQAQNSFDSSLVNMGDHVTATGKKITFTTTSIEDMSSASVSLRGQLNSQVTNLQNVVAANGGLSESTGKAREQMETMRQQIIDNAVAHGVDKDAVTAYVDKLLKIPASIPPTKLDVDKAAAEAKIEAFKLKLASIQNKDVTITTNYVANGKDTGIPNTTNADVTPGIVQKFASGGQVAHLASGGFPGSPSGTDTQAAWLTPGEIVMSLPAVKSIGAGNLLAMNRTGQMPGQATTPAPSNITVYVTNPFTGEQVQAVVQTVATQAANQAITNANNDLHRRPAR